MIGSDLEDQFMKFFLGLERARWKGIAAYNGFSERNVRFMFASFD